LSAPGELQHLKREWDHSQLYVPVEYRRDLLERIIIFLI
jgi:hypothetical protein